MGRRKRVNRERERGGLWGRRGFGGDPPVKFLEKWVFGLSESDEGRAALRL